MRPFDPLLADLADPRRREFWFVTGGHPSRFAPDDISQVYVDVPRKFCWGGRVFRDNFKVYKLKMTNAEAARAFTITVAGEEPAAVLNATRLRNGKIEPNGKRLVMDERA